jgi:HEAT repeat protein
LAEIASDDPEVRTAAWQQAGNYGASAVAPLVNLANTAETEVARAACRGLQKLVREAGRPGNEEVCAGVSAALVAALDEDLSDGTRSEVLWRLSECGGAEAVAPIAANLTREAVREDARMALERIPSDAALEALRRALEEAPEDYRTAVAQSLRARGETIEGYPCVKLTPVKATEVKS